MSRKTSNSRNHFPVRGRDGLLEVLPYRSWTDRPYIDGNPDAEGYVFDVRWHTLNLKSQKSSEILSTMPTGARKFGTAVSCDSRIYVLGGLCGGDAHCPDKMFDGGHRHNCVFYFDSTRDDCVWSEGPPMLTPRDFPSALGIGQKIYVFGSCISDEGPFAEVFNIQLNRWDELPPPSAASDLDPYYVSQRVLFDSSRSRILVHFSYYRSLYAFHPDDGSWECLDPDFGKWSSISVIVDDVAYFLFSIGGGWFAERKKYLRGYHLVKKEWFSIKWSSEPPLAFSVSLPDLIHLGNGILCFAWEGYCFMFEKFRVEFKSGEYHAIPVPEPGSIISVPFEGNMGQIAVL